MVHPKPVKKSFEVLNAKTSKPILSFLEEHYGYTKKFPYALILTAKEKLYCVDREVFELPVERLRVNSFGLYFGEWRKEELRFSIEGSQIVGPDCTKNIIDLDEEQVKQWMFGEDIPRVDTMKGEGYVLIRSGNDFLGCGRLVDDRLMNFVPKNRRVRL